jgi:DhnA family fructose-bisphosphate aldolase class Ia
MVPMDHGLVMGSLKGIEDPIHVFKKFVELKVDAILVNFGILKPIHDYLRDLDNPPGIIMGIDFIEIWNRWKTPIDQEGIINYCTTAKIEQAVKYNVMQSRYIMHSALTRNYRSRP